MMYYRRGVRRRQADSLTVDNVLCKVLPNGHLTRDGKWLCFHKMNIYVPGQQHPQQWPASVSIPDSVQGAILK
jgi:hypothetical protein